MGVWKGLGGFFKDILSDLLTSQASRTGVLCGHLYHAGVAQVQAESSTTGVGVPGSAVGSTVGIPVAETLAFTLLAGAMYTAAMARIVITTISIRIPVTNLSNFTSYTPAHAGKTILYAVNYGLFVCL
ncbi:hypothetical protein RCIA134 [Methanocella arvoryzae MRE50]|uniref:Uncharacterized protein n=1 Tax=Methanocella arvoryzae (strain DSM 22066 / NBRC 105507 / MRE50) TaxID=351160 RepID=Q0W3Y5_METAR|nr:hypothetical protein RCIA134 [Methanocella arvoryzae MRE50]